MNHPVFTSLDQAHAVLRDLGIYNQTNLAGRVKFFNALHDVVAQRPDIPRNKLGQPQVGDINKFLASPAELHAAMVKAKMIEPEMP